MFHGPAFLVLSKDVYTSSSTIAMDAWTDRSINNTEKARNKTFTSKTQLSFPSECNAYLTLRQGLWKSPLQGERQNKYNNTHTLNLATW